MLEKTIELDSFPGSQATFKTLTGPYVLDLTKSNMGGVETYNAFRFAVTGWKDAPLMGEQVSENYDPAVIDMLKPGFVMEVVVAALQASTLSEEQRKNS